MNRDLTRFETDSVPAVASTTISLPGVSHTPAKSSWFGVQWIVLLAIACCLGAALVYLYTATPIYRTHARISVEQHNSLIVEGVESFLYRQRELIRSAPLLEGALADLDTEQMQIFADVDDPFDALDQWLEVSVGTRNEAIILWIDSPFRHNATELIEAIVDAYTVSHEARSDTEESDQLTLLKTELARWEQQREQTKQKIEDFEREYGTIEFEASAAATLSSRVKELGSALNSAERSAASAAAQLEQAEAVMVDLAGISKYIINLHGTGKRLIDPQYKELTKDLFRNRAFLNDPEQNRRPNHPRIIKARKRIQWLEARLGELLIEFRAAYLDDALQQVRLDEQAHEQAAQAFQVQQLKLEEHERERVERKAMAAQQRQLQDDLRQIEGMRSDLYDRINQLAVEERQGSVDVLVIDPARTSSRPIRPNWTAVLGLALAGGLVLGLALALIRQGISDPKGPEALTPDGPTVPVLAVVPRMVGAGDLARILLEDDKCDAAEAFRAARASVCFAMQARQARTLLVSSPSLGDGKTTIASNLAIAMALHGQRVLLIDADLRHPGLDQVYGLSKEGGLGEVLSGRLAIDAATRATEVEQLSVLPAGSAPDDSWAGASAPLIQELLAWFSEQYDYVVIDSAPVMAAPEVAPLSQACDATLLVVKSGNTSRMLSLQACQVLAQSQAFVLGLIVNGGEDAVRQVLGAPAPHAGLLDRR